MKDTKISAVVVTYNPDALTLSEQVCSLIPQLDMIVIVDNGSVEPLPIDVQKNPNCRLLYLHDNYGLSYSQNVGISFAKKMMFDYVLLMDQDSVPNADMVQMLKAGFSDDNIVAVGSSYLDERNNFNSFFVVERNGWPTKVTLNNDGQYPDYIEVAALISSGTLINMQAFDKVGLLRSDYFIDRVDTEWCLRAKSKGYRLLGTKVPLMKHTIGDEVRKIWFFGWRNVPYHSPIRDYYLFRNSIHITRDLPLSFSWRLHFYKILLLYVGYFLVFSDNRIERLSKMWLGLLHGFNNVRGKLK